MDFLANSVGSPFLNVRLTPDTDPGAEEYRIAREASPIYHISDSSCPFLLFHGDSDRAVPIEPVQEFVEKLKTAGVPVEFVVVPGADHGPDLPGAPDDFAIVDYSRPFLDRHLLGAAPEAR